MQKIWYDENGDARCGKCKRLLYKCRGIDPPAGVEIKCHSCKSMNVSEYRFCEKCKWYINEACCNEHSKYLASERRGKDGCEQWEV